MWAPDAGAGLASHGFSFFFLKQLGVPSPPQVLCALRNMPCIIIFFISHRTDYNGTLASDLKVELLRRSRDSNPPLCTPPWTFVLACVHTYVRDVSEWMSKRVSLCSHSCSLVCVCSPVCKRGRQGHTTAACVQRHTSFISVSVMRLCSPLGLELMVKLRTLLTVFILVLKAEARDYGKGCCISDAACGAWPITMNWVS